MLLKSGDTLQECSKASLFPKENVTSTLGKKNSSKTQSTLFEGLEHPCVKPPRDKTVPDHKELVSSLWISPFKKAKKNPKNKTIQ